MTLEELPAVDLPARGARWGETEAPGDPNWVDEADVIVEYDGLWGLIFDEDGNLCRVVDCPNARLS